MDWSRLLRGKELGFRVHKHSSSIAETGHFQVLLRNFPPTQNLVLPAQLKWSCLKLSSQSFSLPEERYKINFKFLYEVIMFSSFLLRQNLYKFSYKCYSSTLVSEKKGTFICELILERYIYLSNTQKQLKITNYVRNKGFLEFYLVYNGVCSKLLGSLL